MPMVEACAARIHDRPDMKVPMAIRRRAPKRSIRLPWKGEKKVCSTISIEKVICSSDSGTPSLAVSGLVNKVHTYCGLEMAIMQIRPINSWNQRLRSKPCALAGAVWVRVVMRFSCTESQSGTAILAGSGRMPLD